MRYRIDALDEEDWKFGDLGIRLFGVFTVIESDTKNLRRLDRREQLECGRGRRGDPVLAEDISLDTMNGPVLLLGPVVGKACLIAISNDSHGRPS
jgi:hypothetical protein